MLSPGTSCGRCRMCLSGEDNSCREYRILGAQVHGGYAELVRCPAANVIPIPDGHLLRGGGRVPARVPHRLADAGHAGARLARGEDVLVWAAGSGVGMAAIQIAKVLGARVIATAGSAAKLARARELGADEVIDHHEQDVVAEVRRLTAKKGVEVVVEHIGQATWERSILSLAHRGRLVTCGATTGPEGKTDLRHLFAKQLTLLGSYMGSKADLLDAARAVLRRPAAAGGARGPAPGGRAARARDDGGLAALREDRAERRVIVPPGRQPRPFAPAWWTRGGHRQTLLGFWYRRRLRWRLPTEDLIADVGDGVRLLLRASWQPGDRARAAGGPARPRPRGVGPRRLRPGHRRLCLRDGLARRAHEHARARETPPASTPASTTRGSTSTSWPRWRRWPRTRRASGSSASRWGPTSRCSRWGAAARWSRLPWRAWSRSRRRSTSPPASTGWSRRSTGPTRRTSCATSATRTAYRQSLRPDLYEAGRELRPRTLREWDEMITAPYGGYVSGAEYYERSSAGPHVAAIRLPTLLLAAEDDPLIPGESVTKWPLPASGVVVREMLPTGRPRRVRGPHPRPGPVLGRGARDGVPGGVTNAAPRRDRIFFVAAFFLAVSSMSERSPTRGRSWSSADSA